MISAISYSLFVCHLMMMDNFGIMTQISMNVIFYLVYWLVFLVS